PNATVQRLAAWLVMRGHDVTVVGTWRGRRPSLDKLRELYGKARIVLHRRFFKDSWHFAPGAVGFAGRLLFSRKDHLIETHGVWLFNGLILSFVAKLKQWRYLVSLHGNLRPVALAKNGALKTLALNLVFRRWLQRAFRVVALNEKEISDARQVVPDASFSVIGNGVAIHHDSVNTDRNNDVLFLGRIDPIKNLESLIDGFSQASREFTVWKLHIVGPCADREYVAQLQSRCEELNIQDRIKFHGAAYGGEKEAWFNSASVFALTSWSEGQPFAVLEAMAHGLPVILSDQCNIDIPETCGRVCDCSPQGVAHALSAIFAMPADAMRNMRSEALRFVATEFSEDCQFNKRISLYVAQA
ncbi:MAG TPA: glycosyltransferase, partial [Desulfomonilaceae bacterium]|nr:glycosyltransferase [Desulfomonilaceae bacterium]